MKHARREEVVKRAVVSASDGPSVEGQPFSGPSAGISLLGEPEAAPAPAVAIEVKKNRSFRKVLGAILAVAVLAAAGFFGVSRWMTDRAAEQVSAHAQEAAVGAFSAVGSVAERIQQARADAYTTAVNQATERTVSEQRRERIIAEAREAAVNEAHAQAIAKAHEEAIEAARAEYDAEVEAVRQRRSSDFSDTIMFGDSIMQNSQGVLSSELPGVTIDAFGGRFLETGPPGAGYDPNDGVLDHIRAYDGNHARVVVGTGNNDAGGMGLDAGEEIVAHFGEDVEIYFVTEYVGGNPGGTASTNATIADLSERYDNVAPVPWFELVSGSPGSYLSDGVHPSSSGMGDYARLVRETISAYEPEPFDPSSVPFDPSSVPFDPSSVEFDPSTVDVGDEPPELTEDIMGASTVPAHALVAVFEEQGTAYPADVYGPAGAETIEDFAKICVEEAEAEGVRADVLFAQAMHETAWLQFGNQVSAQQCNFGGLGAVNSGGAGERFADVREGLRAQVQHLKAYASTDDLENDCVDARFDLVERGSARTVSELGGKWAVPGDTYGEAIMGIVRRMYALEYE